MSMYDKQKPGRKPSPLGKALRTKKDRMDDVLQEWDCIRLLINPNAKKGIVYEEDNFDYDSINDTDEDECRNPD